MATLAFNRFDDPETERRLQVMGRTTRIPFVRVYAVLVMLIILGYSVLNPLYVDSAELVRLNVLLAPTLVMLWAYFGATFWPRYPEFPMIDFAGLLALGMMVTASNIPLLNPLADAHQTILSSGGINRLIVTAFAAVALAGRIRYYFAWILCDMAFFLVMIPASQGSGAGLAYALASYLTGALVMISINFAIDRGSRAAFAFADGLDRERARNEDLVNNMLPPIAAAKLKSGQVVADSFADASVIFVDIVGFSTLAKRISPGHLIELLNAFFSAADQCTAQCGVEKVKTIGDAYLAISGGNIAARNSADTAIEFALMLIGRLPDLRRDTGIDFEVRIGIHSGPVVGGVIGETRMAYDYWGETMNIAARIEGTSHADGIAVSEATYLRVHQTRRFEAPVTLLLKGVGETLVYRLARESAPELRLAG